MKKRKKILLFILILIIVLLLPLIFKDRSQTNFNGPDLSEIKYSEISFMNTSENLKLSGMLMLPKGKGPFPTAVIVQGSGPSFRNNGWYLSVVKHLQDNGIAVVIPDKRGSEKSEGEWRGANFEQLAADAISAIEFTKNQNIYRTSYIGLIGMSQGGWIVPIAATKSEDVSYVVSMSGTTVTPEEQLLFEEINNIEPYTYMFLAKLIAPITTNNIKKKKVFAPFVGFDPIPYWKQINIPVFFGYGENDKNVPVNASINRLKENNLNNIKLKTYPLGGHGIIDVKTSTVNQEYLNDLVKFIKEVKN